MAVYGIGNPLIDFLCYADESDLEALSLSKGTMLLVDEKKRAEILERMKGRKVVCSCGGSCPNTMVTLRALGVETTLAGGIGCDEYGKMYREKLRESGVNDELVEFSASTGTSIILLTEDRERTMNTYLGANRLYDDSCVNPKSVRKAELFYFTGYMWDTDEQRRAVRYRKDFLSIVENFCDIVFANSEEARFLLNNYDAYECCRSMGKLAPIAAVKDGRRGSWVSDNGKLTRIPLYGSSAPVDTTGAGDTYAAGFLYGILNGLTAEQSGKIASYLAGEITGQTGAQFDKKKAEEVRKVISSGTLL